MRKILILMLIALLMIPKAIVLESQMQPTNAISLETDVKVLTEILLKNAEDLSLYIRHELSVLKSYGIEVSKEVLKLIEHFEAVVKEARELYDKGCLLYTSPSPRDLSTSRMPSSA